MVPPGPNISKGPSSFACQFCDDVKLAGFSSEIMVLTTNLIGDFYNSVKKQVSAWLYSPPFSVLT